MPYRRINVLDSVITVQGRVFWNDGRRRIDIKKPIRDVFEPLETDAQRIRYVMELCLSRDKLLQRVRELLDEGSLPILFYFLTERDVSVAEES